MKKRFVVAVDSATKEYNDAFRDYLKSQGLGWWHWLTNVWLLSDSAGCLAAQDIRDALRDYYPGVHTLVIELGETGDTWSGFGPKSDNKNMFKWLYENWTK